MASGGASAQVLEIGDNGAVTVHDRPEVISAEGAAPITPEGGSKTGSEVAPASIVEAAAKAELSPEIVEAVAWCESRMRRGVVSRSGAVGEMQLMPKTARALGVDPSDTRQNYQGGTAYLAGLLRRYHGDIVRALAAYNAGPGAVDRYGGTPPFRETRAYVAAVLDRMSSHAAAQER